MNLDLLRRIDAYLDAVPRAAARTEDIGGLRLFVKEVAEGWPYYARPIPGAGRISAEDLARVRERQRVLGLPESFEWVIEIVPGFSEMLDAAGLVVHPHPLLAAAPGEVRQTEPPEGVVVRMATAHDDIAGLAAVAMAGFAVPGTTADPDTPDQVATLRSTVSAETTAFMRRRQEEGITLTAIATIDRRVVAVGSHQPVGSTTEIVGVTTLPPYRRRGIGAAVTSLLAADAFERDVDLVVLSADGGAVARVYERVGFRRVGEVGAAEPPG